MKPHPYMVKIFTNFIILFSSFFVFGKEDISLSQSTKTVQETENTYNEITKTISLNFKKVVDTLIADLPLTDRIWIVKNFTEICNDEEFSYETLLLVLRKISSFQEKELAVTYLKKWAKNSQKRSEYRWDSSVYNVFLEILTEIIKLPQDQKEWIGNQFTDLNLQPSGFSLKTLQIIQKIHEKPTQNWVLSGFKKLITKTNGYIKYENPDEFVETLFQMSLLDDNEKNWVFENFEKLERSSSVTTYIEKYPHHMFLTLRKIYSLEPSKKEWFLQQFANLPIGYEKDPLVYFEEISM